MRSGCEASTDFSAYALAYALPYDPTPSSGLGRRDLLSPGAVAQVKFDVNRADKHIIQSIAILDTLDKDINTFAMRVKEWYGWHFPELVRTLPSRGYLRAPVLKRPRPRISLHGA